MKTLFNQVFDYLKSVANPTNGSAEAKLFIALTGFGYVILAALVDLFSPLSPSEFVFYTVVSLIVACLGLGTWLGAKNITVRGSVASDIASEKPNKETTEDVKDMLDCKKS